MPFSYQNQVFFRKLSLRFPLKINFLMTIVQNHEKSRAEKKFVPAKHKKACPDCSGTGNMKKLLQCHYTTQAV